MKTNKTAFFILFCLTVSTTFAQDIVTLYGQVTDKNNEPVDSASVWLKNKINNLDINNKRILFDNAYETLTDSNGKFSIAVEKGTYYCLYAIKESDYGKTKLEYWAWNLPIYDDLEINPQYDRMEVYGMNASEPQTGPFDTYQIYFRPMSLTKALALPKGKMDIIDIAPKTISKEELRVQLNGYDAEVVSINKIDEYARGTIMYGYLIQIKKPKEAYAQDHSSQAAKGYDKISITLSSKETNEMGKGEHFVKRIGN